jgi:CRP-like cAMP-binding protein
VICVTSQPRVLRINRERCDNWRELNPMQLLTDIRFFQRLKPATLHRLDTHITTAAHQTGDMIYQQGGPASGLFVLQSGRVKLYRQSHGRIQILALLVPGECFGAESLPEDTPSPFNATALTPTVSLYIPPEHLKTLLDEYPDLQESLLEIVSARLRQFVSLLHDLAFRDVSSRLAMILLSRAHSEGQQTGAGIKFDRLLSQQEFASWVGTVREVIYRTFKKFEKEGLIRLTPDHITILDLQRLDDIANQEVR